MDKIMNVLIRFFDDDLAKVVNFSFHNDSLQDYDIIAICKSTLTLYLIYGWKKYKCIQNFLVFKNYDFYYCVMSEGL